jgi:membrane-associated phospholipid phosphatase
MAGIGGITGMILAISFIYRIDATIILSLCIIIAGLIASSRLALKSHSVGQLAAGFILGCLVVFSFLLQLIY